ncbi:MAG: EAL domain-containing protein [Betaproteobacteria bacterium]|nr:EAL domain-containing protein [Betaproteobacteria bacterium]
MSSLPPGDPAAERPGADLSNPSADAPRPRRSFPDSGPLLQYKIELLYANAAAGLAINMAVSTLLALALWPGASAWLVSAWLLAFYVVTGLRAWDRLLYSRQTDARTSLEWKRRFRLGATATGMCWGASWMLLPADVAPTSELFVAIVLAGMIAAAISHLAVVYSVFRNYAVLALLPAIAYFLARGHAQATFIGLMSVVYLFGVLNSASRFHRMAHRTFEVRSHNAGLVDSLRATNARLQTLTDELEQRVKERTRDLEVELAERQRAEAALKGNEAMFRLITDNVSDMIAVWDRHGEQLYGSRSLTRAMDKGQPADSTPGLAHVHASDLSRLREALRDTLHTSTGRRLELRLKQEDHDPRIIDCSVEPVRDPSGEPDKVVIVARDVTQRRREEALIRDAKERLALAIRATGQNLFDVDCRRKRIYLDAGWAGIMGRSPAESETTFDDLLPLVPPEERVPMGDHYIATLKGEIPEYCFEHRVRADSGEYRWILSRAKVVERSEDGTALRLIGTNVDVTERRRAESALRLARSAMDSMAEGLVILDSAWRIQSVNPAFTRITGFAGHEVVGKVSDLWRRHVRNDELASTIVAEICRSGHWDGRVLDRRRDRSTYPARLSVSAIRDDTGRPTHFVILFSDVTRQEEDDERVRFLAHHDALTGIANRSLFFDRSEDLIRRAQRHGRKLAVLFVDLDQFKAVNDLLGHHAGDELLREAAKRLQAGLRDLDMVARLGGDEFAVLLEEIDEPSDAATVATKLLATLAEPVHIRGHSLKITASIGISCFPDDAGSAEVLVQQADAAMYSAKEEGRNRFRFFAPDITARVMLRLAMANGLRSAVERDELELYYQPAVDARGGQIVGLEALLRWRHPQRGMLLPGEFIEVAEETGAIDSIGRWVLSEACRQLSVWQSEGHVHLTMKVNLSALQFRQPTLLQQIREILDRSDLVPGTLEFEITESAAMDDPERSESVLRELRTLGIRIALDDFGTGHSSLAQLSRFPIQCLKIDRSLVAGLPYDRKNVVIASTVANLCRNLGLEMIGEGVESQAQAAFLLAQGCQQMQGFLFSPPVDATRLSALLNAGVHPDWAISGQTQMH